jgi:uncharacterized protein YbcI
MDTDAEARDEHSAHRVDLCNAMVGLYKEQFGRGPTKARADYMSPDLIVITLEDTMTPAERKMVERGDHHRLRDLRLYFQYASADDFVGAVEEITSRKVRAYMSAIDTRVDVAAEFFYLEARN